MLGFNKSVSNVPLGQFFSMRIHEGHDDANFMKRPPSSHRSIRVAVF
jgi:hypothetical protein